MRSDAPSLLPIFRSRHQAELLTRLFMQPDREFTMGELARLLSVSLSTVHMEVARLASASLIAERSAGRTRLLRANLDHRLSRPLAELLIGTFGPHTVVAEEFGDLDGIERVLIYGSWAARYNGVNGPPPSDIDVLLIGKPSNRDAVYEAADRAHQRLDIPVNPVVSSRSRWDAATDALIRTVQDGYIVDVEQADTE